MINLRIYEWMDLLERNRKKKDYFFGNYPDQNIVSSDWALLAPLVKLRFFGLRGNPNTPIFENVLDTNCKM